MKWRIAISIDQVLAITRWFYAFRPIPDRIYWRAGICSRELGHRAPHERETSV